MATAQRNVSPAVVGAENSLNLAGVLGGSWPSDLDANATINSVTIYVEVTGAGFGDDTWGIVSADAEASGVSQASIAVSGSGFQNTTQTWGPTADATPGASAHLIDELDVDLSYSKTKGSDGASMTLTVNSYVLIDYTPAGPAFSGSGAISHGHTVTATGFKGGQGEAGELVGGGGVGHLLLDGTGDYASTADKAALDITGDFEIIACVASDDWASNANRWILNKFDGVPSARAYAFGMSSGNLIQLGVSDGTTTHYPTGPGVQAETGVANGDHLWLRATFDADTGASDSNTRFYYSADPITSDPGSITWTEFTGGPEVTGTAITIPATAETLEIGRFSTAGGDWDGKIYGVWLYDGIGGTLVADPDFRDGDITTDSTGNTWTKQGDAAYADQTYGGAPVLEDDFTTADSETLPTPWAETDPASGQGGAAIVSNTLRLTYIDTSNGHADAYLNGTAYEVEDGEALFKFDTALADFACDLHLYFRGTEANPQSATFDGYFARTRIRDGTWELGAIARVDDGVETTLAADITTASPQASDDLTFWMRARWENTALKVRVWEDGTTEPTAWNAEATDSTYTAGGIVGLYIVRGGSGGSVDIDDFTLTDLSLGALTIGPISHGHTVTATGTVGTGPPAFSGSGSISHGHTVIATGVKGGEGAGSISHGHTTAATGDHLEERSGTAAISHGHTVTAAGSAVEARSGSAAISHGHTTAATGDKAEDRTGAGSISHGHTVTATGTRAEDRTGTASISHGHTVTAVGARAEDKSGSATVSHGHTVTATGSAAEAKSGSGAVSHGHTVAAYTTVRLDKYQFRDDDGGVDPTGSALIVETDGFNVVRGQGVQRYWIGYRIVNGSDGFSLSFGILDLRWRLNGGAWADVWDSGNQTANVHMGTASGVNTSGVEIMDAVVGGYSPNTQHRWVDNDYLTATAVGAGSFREHWYYVVVDTDAFAEGDIIEFGANTNDVEEDRTGSFLQQGAVNHITFVGDDRTGSASVGHSHTVTATGLKGGAGSGTVSHGHTVTADGGPAEARTGSGAISHGHTVAATGQTLESRAGSGAITHAHAVTATGSKGGAGTGSVIHDHAVTATGDALEVRSGAAAISHGHTVTAIGITSQANAGSGVTTNGHTVTATGVKGGTGTATISHPHTVTASGTGSNQPTGFGAVTHSHTVVVTGLKGGAGSAAFSHGHQALAVAVKGGDGAAVMNVHHTVAAVGVAAEYEGSALNAYVGGVWVAGRLKRYSGTGWAGALIRRWNGTSWEDMP